MEYSDLSYMDQNLYGIRRRIEDAKQRCGNEDVLMVAAVKYTDAEHINYLHTVLGVHDIGENRVQQLLEHWEQLDRKDLRIHFIGKLQRNKVKYIIDKVCMIHSLDSLSLAEEIQKRAAEKGIVMDVLVEINSGEEENKSGIMPKDAEDFCKALSEFDSIKLRGFMTMAPKCEKKEDYRKYFSETYKLVLDIWTKKLHNIDMPIISMGMSESFEEAVREGSDIVRVGRGLFVK
jgi:pyridoxal phosphate enzyme (YggS family)